MRISTIAVIMLCSSALWVQAAPQVQPFDNSQRSAPKDYTGPIFTLSHAYPNSGTVPDMPWGVLQTHSLLRYLQDSQARHSQVAQREHTLDLCCVLRKISVAHFHEAELALDHPEWMLDLGANAGLDVLA